MHVLFESPATRCGAAEFGGIAIMRILFLVPFIPSVERPDSLHHVGSCHTTMMLASFAVYAQDAKLTGLAQVKLWAKDVHLLKLSRHASYLNCQISLVHALASLLGVFFYHPAIMQ